MRLEISNRIRQVAASVPEWRTAKHSRIRGEAARREMLPPDKPLEIREEICRLVDLLKRRGLVQILRS